jgi:hypothetical protein
MAVTGLWPRTGGERHHADIPDHIVEFAQRPLEPRGDRSISHQGSGLEDQAGAEQPAHDHVGQFGAVRHWRSRRAAIAGIWPLNGVSHGSRRYEIAAHGDGASSEIKGAKLPKADPVPS